MKFLPLAAVIALFVGLLDPVGIAFVSRASAETQDDVQLKWRNAVFRKYGQPRPEYGGKGRRIPSALFVRAFDQCVASRGKSF
jgi:hypothetical protein